MKRTLLAAMSVALAAGPMNAQVQMVQVSPASKMAKDAAILPKSNVKLDGKATLINRSSREGEEAVVVQPKTLTNMGGWGRNVYEVDLTPLNLPKGTVLKVGTFYDPLLVDRFDGNTITKIKTVVGPNMKDLKALIINPMTGDLLWEGKTLSSIHNTTAKSKEVEFDCDYVIDKSTPIAVLYQGTMKSNSTKAALIDNVVNLGWILGAGDKLQDFTYEVDAGMGGASAYIECETSGAGGLKANDVCVFDVAGARLMTNGKYETVASFINYGTAPISKLETAYKVGESTTTEELGAEQPFPYMVPVQVRLTSDAPADAARYPLTFSIEKVNGVADEYDAKHEWTNKGDNVAYNMLTAMETAYPRTVVMEQFTGLWCPWCPRGHVAMEKAAKTYADKFIGIAVHANDQMQSDDYLGLLQTISNYPSAMLNRVGNVLMDPYYGTKGPAQRPGDKSGDILEDIKVVSEMPVEAQVGFSSQLDESKKSVTINSKMSFSLNTEGKNYSVAYVLLENGIKGYPQKNAYSKDAGAFKSAEEIAEDDLRHLFNEKMMYTPTFNGVARSIKDVMGIEGSLDNVTVKVGEELTHTYTLAIPSTVKDVNNLEVAVLVIDNYSGEILNAAKAKIGETTTGVESVAAEGVEIAVENGTVNVQGNGSVSVYSMDGKLVKTFLVDGSASMPTMGMKGTYIVRVVNGNHVTVKKVLL